MKLVCLLLASIFSVGSCYPNGADPGACQTLEPFHAAPGEGVTELTGKYALTYVDRSYYVPGRILKIRLSKIDAAEDKYGKFKGILLRACKHKKGTPPTPENIIDIGRWEISNEQSNNFHHLSCHEDNGETHVTHKNRDFKDVGEVFTWRAPSTPCQNNMEYFFSATVVYERLEYQLGLFAAMACQPACQAKQGKGVIIPRGGNADFSSGDFVTINQRIVGWANIYEHIGCQFLHKSSGETGFYLEHRPPPSTPLYSNKYLAILRSPYSFRGCMCLKFKCRMEKTKEDGYVRLSLLANGGLLLMDTDIVSGPGWVMSQKSIVTAAEAATFNFVSETRDGFVELDDIVFSSGLCEGATDADIFYVN